VNKNLPAIKQNAQAVLVKSNNLMNITNKILANKASIPEEVIEEWIRALWEWADEYNIPNSHFPRDRTKLLALTQINFFKMKLESIPKEFGALIHLITLDLWDNHIASLPDEIEFLVNLKKLQLRGNPLILTSQQKLWIEALKKNGCTVYMDNVPLMSSDIGDAKTIMPVSPPAHSTTLATAFKYKPFVQRGRKAYFVSFSPERKMSLFGSENKILKLLCIVDGENIGTFRWDADSINAVSASPNDEMDLSGSGVIAWHVSLFCSPVYSPDGTMVLSGGGDEYDILELWNVNTNRKIRTFEGDMGWFISATFSPDGKTVLSGGFDDYSGNGILKLWDIVTGREIRTFEGHSDTISSVVFSPDGNMILLGSDDKTLKLWDISTDRELLAFEGHIGPVDSVSFSPDGRIALSRSRNEPLKLWDISTGKEIQTMITFENGDWVTITPDGYFNHSTNGRQYLNVMTSPMSAIAIDDVTYNHYYQPNGLLNNDSSKSNLPEIDTNFDEIPF
jgi:WD40 repeat protein